MLGVDQAVIGGVRLVEHRKAARVLLPREAAAIDDGAAERGAVPAHELGERMHHDIGAVVDRPQQDRRGNGIVDDERNAVAGADRGQRLDVADIAGRIADALAEDRARFLVDQLFDRAGLIGFGKARGDALAWQDMAEQRVGRAVELRHRDDIAAHLGEVEHRVVERRLPRAHAHRLEAAFERGDAALKHRDGRIADAAVAEAFDFKIEQRGAVLGAVELVGYGLIDRNRDGLGRRLGFITAVDGDCVAFHIVPPYV